MILKKFFIRKNLLEKNKKYKNYTFLKTKISDIFITITSFLLSFFGKKNDIKITSVIKIT